MVDAVVYPEASAPDGPASPVMMRMVQHAVDRKGREEPRQAARDGVNMEPIGDQVPARPNKAGRYEPREADQKLRRLVVHLMPHTPQRHSCVIQPAMGGVFGDRPGHNPDCHARECHVGCCIEHAHIPREKEESNGRIRHEPDPVIRWVRGDELDEPTRPSRDAPVDGRQAECTSANGSHWTDLSLHTRNAQLSRPPWRGAIRLPNRSSERPTAGEVFLTRSALLLARRRLQVRAALIRDLPVPMRRLDAESRSSRSFQSSRGSYGTADAACLRARLDCREEHPGGTRRTI